MSRICFVAFVAITVVFADLPARAKANVQETEKNEIVRSDLGFRLVRPEAWVEWQQQTATGSMQFSIAPRDAAGRIQASIITTPVTANQAEPVAARDYALQSTKEKEGFSNIAKEEIEIAGRMTPGFRLNWNTAGETFHLQQYYLVENERIYTLTFHCPVEEFAKWEPLFLQLRKSLQFLPIDESALRKQTLQTMAARCGSDLPWAKDWDAAATRARTEQKAVLVFIRQQSGFDIADAVSIGALTDPDVLALIEERCIPFRFRKGMDAPFVSHDVYGISGSSFGSTILLVTAEGNVIGDTFTNEPVSFQEFLLESLAKHTESNAVSAPIGLHGTVLAQWHARRGEFDKALAAIGEGVTFDDHLLKASIFRRQRKGEAAIKQLEQSVAPSGVESHPQADLQQAIVCFRMGQYAQARELLDEIVASDQASESLPEALYWLGSVQLRMAARTLAGETWTRLIDNHSESRWAWKAAAFLGNLAFELGATERLQWPNEESLAVLKSHPFESVPVSELDRAEKEAIDYLLKSQRTDGSWISPTDGLGTVTHLVNAFTMATTGICGRALLGTGENPTAIDAKKRAVNFLLAARKLEKAAGIKPYYMDYSPWSHSYVLSFLVACSQEGIVDPAVLQSPIDDLIADLRKSQKPGGGWSYYVSMTLARADQPENQSISFMTAAVVMALMDARDAGFQIPDGMIDSSLTCLERMRHPNTAFDYFLWHDRDGERTGIAHEGAAGRGPLCSLALYRGDRGSLDEIRGCLDIFMEHRESYSREKGKTLMHAAPGGQGSHYLMFDYAWAATAIAQLPLEEQARYATPLLQQILDARSVQGSYLDNPLNGWHYGTGMALSAFQHLRISGE